MKWFMLLVAALLVEVGIANKPSLAQLPFEEMWRCEIDSPAICLGDVWLEGESLRAIIGTASGVIIAGDEGITWRSEQIGNVTATAALFDQDRTLEEIFATTLSDTTGIIYRFFGDHFEASQTGFFGSHYDDGEYSMDTRIAHNVIIPQDFNDNHELWILVRAYSSSYNPFHGESASETGSALDFSISDMTQISEFEIGSPKSGTYLRSEFAGENWFASVGYFYDYWNTDQGSGIRESSSIHFFNSDSIQTIALPGIAGGVCEVGTDSTISILSNSWRYLTILSYPDCQLVDRIATGIYQFRDIKLFESSQQKFALVYGLDGNSRWCAEIIHIPSLTLIEHDSFYHPYGPIGTATIDLDRDGSDELIVLTSSMLIGYSIPPLSVRNTFHSLHPSTLSLSSYPNPFNSSTTISYSLPKPGRCALSVVDITGREVARLSDGWKSAGSYRAIWNANSAASGNYRLVLQNELELRAQPITLVR